MDEKDIAEFRELADKADYAFRHNDPKGAVVIGNELRRRFPHDPCGWFHAARAMRDMGKLEETELLLSDAPDRFPDDLPILSIWTSLPRARRNSAEALQRADWLLGRFPDEPSPHTHLARCLIAAGRKPEALQVATAALMRWPDDQGLRDCRSEASPA